MSHAATAAHKPFLLRHACGRAPLSYFAILLLPLLASGCGTEIYEQRLAKTEKLFEYHDLLNQNLQGVWAQPRFGLSMRIPIGFQLLPAPPEPKVLEDGSVEVVEDTRHPSFLGIELPGLVDAWQIADVGSLYVCTNHTRFYEQPKEGEDAKAPEDFFKDLEATLQEGLKFTLSAEEAKTPGELNAKIQEKIPPAAIDDNEFAPSKDFATIDIGPGEIKDVPPLTGHLYEIQSGDIQTAIVLIYLKSAPSDPNRPVRLALETLQVSSQLPKPPANGESKGGGGDSTINF